MYGVDKMNIFEQRLNMKKTKTILGLDLGTNSIGWALINQDFEQKYGEIVGIGSRIIPMSQDILGDFEKGNKISQTAERTRLRGMRRLKERHLLRRERLHRVLHVLGFLPSHYAASIDFDIRVGKFLPETEAKLPYDGNGNFIFRDSFEEMLADFSQHQPALVADGKKVPYDWTIYYLRKKALSELITDEELAWLLLHFNQKRGYYQLRGEEAEDKPNKTEAYYSLRIDDVTADEPQKGKSEIWYNIMLENGWVYRRASKTPLYDWKGNVKDFVVTTELNEDGSIKMDKEGKEKRSFRAPKDDDWQLMKKKTENEITQSNSTVGVYIYDTLLRNPGQKIKGKLVKTIERKYYKEELVQILQKQVALNPALRDTAKYKECVAELYPHNHNHQATLFQKDFVHLFTEDILYYQRPLRSQKSAIGNCPLESRIYVLDGVKKVAPLKCIPKSHPLYQEFRLWQWIRNLHIYRKDEEQVPVTKELLPDIAGYEKLFAFLNTQKEITNKALLKHLLAPLKLKGKALDAAVNKYRWNYAYDETAKTEKSYPCNETRAAIMSRLAQVAYLPEDFLTRTREETLWHIIYSVTDKKEYEKALRSFAEKNSINVDSFYEAFRRFPPFPADYGAYSAKAIKKLLPLMRMGHYQDRTAIDDRTRDRIEKIINAEYDDSIKEQVRVKAIHLTTEAHFQGLPEWLAKYIVYDRHAEGKDTGRWKCVAEMEEYLKGFRQHSLRNPIVEQVITEALRLVKDIWQHYGHGAENYFDEIHIELGREMKNPLSVRQEMAAKQSINENTNLRIKALLAELLNDNAVENVRPYSPMQQEILKIYEDTVLHQDIDIPDDIVKISKMAQPSGAELQRYKLWLEQKYRSPYTGDIIPLNKLFTPAYEIEHIIPQSRYFDDSASNKVICEAAVNKLKDNMTGLEFIRNHHGQVVETGMGKSVKIFTEEAYTQFATQHYAGNRAKKMKLLSADVPEKMIARQLNDTRYISRYVMQVLSNLVREQKNDDGVNSKNILAANGQITQKLRQDWGLDAIWNELILPRFERLNQLTGTTDYTVYNERYRKYLPAVPYDQQKGFQKKRIDHRHHAMDALVMACATRSHINYLNNQHALNKTKTKDERQRDRHDLKVLLCDKKFNSGNTGDYAWIFKKPWSNFIADARAQLEKVIVSFRQNLRIINKTANYYERLRDGKKELVKQMKGENWAIRKSLHKDTVSGVVSLRKTRQVKLAVALDEPGSIVNKDVRSYIQKMIANGYDKKRLQKHLKDNGNRINGVDISVVDIYYWDNGNVASRTSLDTSFDKKKIAAVTDTGIQKILLRQLELHAGKPELAFSPEGIEEMNRNMTALNEGRPHKPVYKVRTYEVMGNKFPVGQTGNKRYKYVEADKGTNLFFAIYEDEEGKRSYETIPLNIAIERQKQGLYVVPEENEKGNRLAFYLSPNDLVYVGDMDISDRTNLSLADCSNVYKMVSSSGSQCFFIRHDVSTPIINKLEYSPLNKMERSVEGVMIKENCIKLSVNRLGFVSKILP